MNNHRFSIKISINGSCYLASSASNIYFEVPYVNNNSLHFNSLEYCKEFIKILFNGPFFPSNIEKSNTLDSKCIIVEEKKELNSWEIINYFPIISFLSLNK